MAVVWFIALTLLTAWIDSKKKIEEPVAIQEEDFSFPTNSKERQLQIIYGEVKMTSPNVMAKGGYRQDPIKIKQGGIFKKKVTIGYRTYLGLSMGIGFGGEHLELDMLEFYANDELVYSNTASGSFSASVNKGELFGDRKEGEGGMIGNFSFYSGAKTQVIDSYCDGITNGRSPPYNNFSYFVWKGGTIGNNMSAVPTWHYILRRIPKFPNFSNLHHDVMGGANPAEVIYDLLTNKQYGLGDQITDNDIDIVQFRSIAKIMFDEGFGINLLINEKPDISKVIEDIMTKIDGSLNFNRKTGKFYIKLNRQDYDVATLKTFDESNILSLSNFSRNTYQSLANQMKLTYTDKANGYIARQLTFKDTSLIDQMGGFETIETDFSMVTNPVLAHQLAIRELIPLSTNLFKCEIKVNRHGNVVEIGDCILLNLKKHKIDNVVMRVIEIDYGNITNPDITLSLVQDKFGFTYQVSDNAPTPPVPTDYTALPIDLKVVEAPYFYTRDTDINSVALGFAQRPSQTHIGWVFKTKTSTDPDYIQNDEIDEFCPVASFETAVSEIDTTIKINGLFNFEQVEAETLDDLRNGDNLAIVMEGSKQEYIAFTSYNTTTGMLVGVKRGLLDTIPLQFTAAAKIYVINYGYALSRSSFTGTINCRYISKTEKQELVNTVTTALTETNRKNRPIVPGNLKFNNVPFTYVMNGVSSTTDLTISYAARPKTKIVQFFDVNQANTDGTTYRIRIYNNTTGTLVKSADITDLSYVFDDELTINGGVRFASLRVEIDAIQTGIVSAFKFSIILNR